MALQFTPYVFAYLLAGALALATALYVWPHRGARGAWPLFVALLTEVYWAFGAAVGYSCSTLRGQLFFLRFTYLAIVCLPVALIAFALAYSRRDLWLTRRTIAALLVIPLLTFCLLLTNDAHGLMYRHIGLETTAGFVRLVVMHGPWFWVHVSFSYALCLLGSLLIVLTVLEAPSYRSQAMLLLFGALVPVLGNFVQVAGLNPLPVDLTPLAFSIGSTSIGLSLFRYHLLDITPVARSKVIEELADGVLVLDVQNRIVDANTGALRILDSSAAEVIGRPATEVLSAHPDIVNRYGDIAQGETEIALHTRGAQRHYALRFSPISGSAGTNIGRVIVARDITERVRLIEELDAYSRVVAHDLKDPIAVISGYAELLSDQLGESLAPETRELLDATRRGCERMTRIVDELLTLSHVRTRDNLLLGPLNMPRILTEVTDRLHSAIAATGAQIRMSDDWPTAQGYAAWVEEVWANYISNAIKYGGSPPRIELGGEAMNDGMVRFWARDNGRGIAAQDQTLLFREFSRLNGSPADSHGLGLSIVKRIVEKLGGEVGVESSLGQGSKFWFTLPS